jgi:hypothetical protein
MIKQATPEWWGLKRGIPSSSDFDRIITPAKGELSKSAKGYMAQLIADVFWPTANYFTEQGRPINTYAMQNGTDTEPEARKWLSFDAGLDVQEVGFVINDDFTCGCSPDGMLGFDMPKGEAAGEWRDHPYFQATCAATVELKCPLLATQAEYLLDGELPMQYKPQVHGHMVVTGATKVEFVSYARGLPPLRLTVERDGYTDKVEAAVKQFVADYQAALERMRKR